MKFIHFYDGYEIELTIQKVEIVVLCGGFFYCKFLQLPYSPRLILIYFIFIVQRILSRKLPFVNHFHCVPNKKFPSCHLTGFR